MRKTQEIREAIATKLTALIGLDTNPYFKKVYSVRKNIIADTNLPAAVVTVLGGVHDESFSPQEITASLNIEIKDKGDNIEDILDDHAEKVESIFKVGETLNDLIEYMNPQSFDYSLDTESTAGTIILNYTIKYEV